MFQVNSSVIFTKPCCLLKVPQKRTKTILLSFESTTKKNRNHIALMKLRKTNTTLISSFHTKSLETLTNGAAPSVHKEHVCAIKKENLLKKIVSFEDWKAFTETIFVSFTTKNSIPFTLVPHINLAQQIYYQF